MFCIPGIHKQLTANAGDLAQRNSSAHARGVTWTTLGKFTIGTLMASVIRRGHAAVVSVSTEPQPPI